MADTVGVGTERPATERPAAERPVAPRRNREASAADWLGANARALAIGIAGVAAAAAIYWAYSAAKVSKDEKAEQALASAQTAVYSGNAPLAQSDLRKVTTRFDGTPAAARARVQLAQLLFEEGKYAEGMTELDKAAGDGPDSMEPAIDALRAAGLEEQGKFVEAAQAYLKAANESQFDLDKQKLKADAARAYMQANNKTEARKLWEELAKDESGPLAGEARVRLGELAVDAASRS